MLAQRGTAAPSLFKVVHHSRIVTFQMAEVAVSKEVWAEMLSRIDRLRWMTA